MHVTYCYVCNRQSGFGRRLGWGTFFMVLLTFGLWLLIIPFYPIRCTTCGCSRSDSDPAPGVPSQRGLSGGLTPWEIVGLVLVVGIILCCFLYALTFSDRASNGQEPTPSDAVSSLDGTSSTEVRQKHGKARYFVAVTDASQMIDPVKEGHNWLLATGHLTVPGTTSAQQRALHKLETMGNVKLMCSDVWRTCLALRPGQTYEFQEVKPSDPDYANSGCNTQGACVRIYGQNGGKEIKVLYTMSPEVRAQDESERGEPLEGSNDSHSNPAGRGTLTLTVSRTIDGPRTISMIGRAGSVSVYASEGILSSPRGTLPTMELLCDASRNDCFPLRPGAVYGADSVKKGEPDFSSFLADRNYSCVRIYGPSHTTIYAVGQGQGLFWVPTLDQIEAEQ